MKKTRENHYVPQWYQRGFLADNQHQLHVLNLAPDVVVHNGVERTKNSLKRQSPKLSFVETDLYTTFFGEFINDDIENYLFGEIDDTGAAAVRAFTSDDPRQWHKHFQNFFEFIDAQKLRTPKGLDWIQAQYPKLDQVELMLEMQGLRTLHCTMWAEGVREIVSAKDSEVKFIVSDHPVTVYNHACPLDSESCAYPHEPSTALKASQTIFVLDQDHCLILTNYEYAKNPDLNDPLEKRTNARHFAQSMARTDAFITSRNLCVSDVQKINYIVKCRAKRYIAAGEREWLYPEKAVNCTWGELKGVLLPPENGMFHFGGEMFVGYKDGSTYYQDAFGRTNPDSEFLQKVKPVKKQRRNSLCRCGSGKKYKKCCLNKREEEKSTSAVLSIRERNLAFINCVTDVLGLNDGKTWDDVRKELSGDQIKEIYRFYGHLWPKDTDYISLLPKPDGTLRALYTGIVDPQAITLTITSMTLYCDEILVVSPFVNPALMNPEFSPLENPHQYKHDTLKNIMLLLMLEPYIKKGYINLIPDLFVANPYLGRQAMSMAEERLKDTEVNEEQSSQLRMLMEADAKRAYQMMPDTYHRQSILETYPDMPEERVVALIEHVHQTRAADPLTLLQDNVYSAGGGQLMKTNLTPNFEYSLLIAQITGSFILSDSPHRKMEILASCAIDDVQLDIASLISSKDFLLNINCSAAFRVRKSGKLGEIRSVLRETLIAAKGSKGKVVTSKYMKGLEARYDKAHTIAQREMSSIDDALGCDGESFDQQNIQCKLSCIIPIQGFSDKNVQRLLISWGSTIHLSSVPMAIFVDRSEKS